MKLLSASSLLSLCLYSTAQAAEAPAGRVYLYERDTSVRPPQSQTVDPQTARLIFAQRLGLSQFAPIEASDKDVIQQLNWYSGRWQAPFHLEKQVQAPSKRVIVFVEGLKDAERFVDCPSSSQCPYSEFTMSSPPQIDENAGLLSDFRTLSKSLYPPGSYSSGHAHFHEILAPIQAKNHDELVTSVHDNVFIHLNINTIGSGSYEKTAEFVRGAISDIFKLGQKEDMSVTVALFPPASKFSKRATNPYGIRDIKQSEAPMTFENPSPAKAASVVKIQSSPAAPFASVTRGILPSCFSTNSDCQSRTANCTGRGACFLRNKDKSHDGRECWTCGCKPTIEKNSNGGRKTTNWGGAACQKKDISIQFWMLAGFTIFLVGIISWAIGLLYSMGEEELPSVIGAGVSGPRAK